MKTTDKNKNNIQILAPIKKKKKISSGGGNDETSVFGSSKNKEKVMKRKMFEKECICVST